MTSSNTTARPGRLAPLIRIPAWFLVSPWRYIALLITVVLSQWTLFRADLVFERISGFPTLDTQNDLTAQGAREQIRSYSVDAVQAYELFAAIDYLFPLAASLFLAATVLWLIRVAKRSTSWRVPEATALLLLLPVVFDYMENIFLALAVASDGGDVVIAIALVAKSLKLASLMLCGVLGGMALLYTCVVVIRRRIRARRS